MHDPIDELSFVDDAAGLIRTLETHFRATAAVTQAGRTRAHAGNASAEDDGAAAVAATESNGDDTGAKEMGADMEAARERAEQEKAAAFRALRSMLLGLQRPHAFFLLGYLVCHSADEGVRGAAAKFLLYNFASLRYLPADTDKHNYTHAREVLAAKIRDLLVTATPNSLFARVLAHVVVRCTLAGFIPDKLEVQIQAGLASASPDTRAHALMLAQVGFSAVEGFVMHEGDVLRAIAFCILGAVLESQPVALRTSALGAVGAYFSRFPDPEGVEPAESMLSAMDAALTMLPSICGAVTERDEESMVVRFLDVLGRAFTDEPEWLRPRVRAITGALFAVLESQEKAKIWIAALDVCRAIMESSASAGVGRNFPEQVRSCHRINTPGLTLIRYHLTMFGVQLVNVTMKALDSVSLNQVQTRWRAAADSGVAEPLLHGCDLERTAVATASEALLSLKKTRMLALTRELIQQRVADGSENRVGAALLLVIGIHSGQPEILKHTHAECIGFAKLAMAHASGCVKWLAVLMVGALWMAASRRPADGLYDLVTTVVDLLSDVSDDMVGAAMSALGMLQDPLPEAAVLALKPSLGVLLDAACDDARALLVRRRALVALGTLICVIYTHDAAACSIVVRKLVGYCNDARAPPRVRREMFLALALACSEGALAALEEEETASVFTCMKWCLGHAMTLRPEIASEVQRAACLVMSAFQDWYLHVAIEVVDLSMHWLTASDLVPLDDLEDGDGGDDSGLVLGNRYDEHGDDHDERAARLNHAVHEAKTTALDLLDELFYGKLTQEECMSAVIRCAGSVVEATEHPVQAVAGQALLVLSRMLAHEEGALPEPVRVRLAPAVAERSLQQWTGADKIAIKFALDAVSVLPATDIANFCVEQERDMVECLVAILRGEARDGARRERADDDHDDASSVDEDDDLIPSVWNALESVVAAQTPTAKATASEILALILSEQTPDRLGPAAGTLSTLIRNHMLEERTTAAAPLHLALRKWITTAHPELRRNGALCVGYLAEHYAGTTLAPDAVTVNALITLARAQVRKRTGLHEPARTSDFDEDEEGMIDNFCAAVARVLAAGLVTGAARANALELVLALMPLRVDFDEVPCVLRMLATATAAGELASPQVMQVLVLAVAAIAPASNSESMRLSQADQDAIVAAFQSAFVSAAAIPVIADAMRALPAAVRATLETVVLPVANLPALDAAVTADNGR